MQKLKSKKTGEIPLITHPRASERIRTAPTRKVKKRKTETC
jgi:hypothetical protein